MCNMQPTQYVGKNNTPFNIRLNNHRKDLKDSKVILQINTFIDFTEHARFTIIDKIDTHKP